MSRVEGQLRKMGLTLPPDWTPRGQFLPFRRDGRVVYLSGQICEWDGEVTHSGPVEETPKGSEAGRKAAQIRSTCCTGCARRATAIWTGSSAFCGSAVL